MTKLLIGLLGAGVIATGGYAAATSVDADPARTVSLPGATSTGDTTTAGTTTADATTADTTTAATTTDDAPAPRPAPVATTTTDDGNDISGPCDEAEHANDPRCTGEIAGDDRDDDRRGTDDSSGHGSGNDDDDDDDDDDEDRSGSDSGRG